MNDRTRDRKERPVRERKKRRGGRKLDRMRVIIINDIFFPICIFKTVKLTDSETVRQTEGREIETKID